MSIQGSFKFVRMFQMGIFGALFHGPIGHHFYKMLGKVIPGNSKGDVTTKVLWVEFPIRVVSHQFFWSGSCRSNWICSVLGLSLGGVPWRSGWIFPTCDIWIIQINIVRVGFSFLVHMASCSCDQLPVCSSQQKVAVFQCRASAAQCSFQLLRS